MISSCSSPSTRPSATRSVSAISDSGIPNSRSIRCSYSVRPAVAAANSSLATAVGHIAWSSRGGPGMTTTVGPSRPSAGGTTSPGAVPAGSITNEPSGMIACLRLASRTASKSRLRQRFMSGLRMSAIRSSSASSSTISRPWKRADDLRGEVVRRRAEAAARDDHVDALVRHEAQLRLHVRRPVAADRDVGQLDPELEQPVGEPWAVAVLHPSGEDLGAGYDYPRACAHAQGRSPLGSSSRLPLRVNSKPIGSGLFVSNATGFPFTRSSAERLPRLIRSMSGAR